MEKIFIEFMLQKNGWNVSKTAQALDIQRSHLYNKMERYDIRKTSGGDE
ncbi:helix-turn-helix domain-containing protein [uncultured Chitinophaga sp.]|nr:helix-turn-helix domain-containing protein [uncultured Chitinophaga sp.]